MCFSEGNEDLENTQNVNDGDFLFPKRTAVRKLNEKATSRLAQLTRYASSDEHHAAEIVAAKSLLDRSTQIKQR